MKKIALIFIAFFTFALLHSQVTEESKPKKVGLVLSGGGAKGFAHIGALKVIEEAGVKIDFIGGTSMGAIVGGLYASGYNATQIDSLFKQTDFEELINDFIPRSSKTFYEKKNDESYAVILPFDKFKIDFPEAISKGMYSYNMINEATRNVRHVRDFNELPIPFFCVATDIETGNEVILNKGNLSQALLASSAFPTLFPPVELNGMFLIDGGVADNYPIDELRRMGAEVIIGVDVQQGLLDRKDLKNATKILVQIANLQTIKKMKENIGITDIYIKPEIKDYGVVSFEKGAEIIRKGEEATFVVYEKLIQIAENPKYVKPKLNLVSDTLSIENINCNQLDFYTKEYVLGKLRFKPNTKITYAQLIKGINNLSATQNFGAINYSLDLGENGGDDLNIFLKENPVKTFLKLAIHYDGLYKSGILVNVTHKKAFFKNDIVSFDAIIAEDFRYNFDYYVENGFNLSLGFKSRYNQFSINENYGYTTLNKDAATINSIDVYYSNFTNQIYFQSLLSNKFLIGGGLSLDYLDISFDDDISSSPQIDESSYFSVFAYMKYDSFDNKYFPNKGWYMSGDLQSYLVSSNYTGDFIPFSILKGEVGVVKNIFHKTTLKLGAEGGFSFGNQSVHFFDFVLGGYGFKTINNFRHFYGYDFLSIAGNSYLKADATIDYEFIKKNHLNATANFAYLKDDLFQTLDWISLPRITGYAVGYGLETLIGPIEVKYSYSPEIKENFFWVSIGFWF
ncbi:MAG TPA: patatin-like phospholipase family protein [Flavobacterium sp.]|nr:patatin-like phospholipase family protein [Flavobacterium sp.]